MTGVRRPVTAKPGVLTWLVLVGATVVSWILGADHRTIGGARAATVAVLIIAFIKVLLVGANFMELSQAPRLLVGLFAGWAIVTCAVLTTVFVVG